MAETSGEQTRRRARLTREVVLLAAVRLADEEGIAAVTMRRLAQELAVEAMSLYHHVANKDALLDGMVDLVFAEIEVPARGAPWKTALRARSISVRKALGAHRWAIGLMESRAAPGPATLHHHDAVIGCLRAGGFSVAATAHAFSLLDSYIYGFVLQHVNLPFDNTNATEMATAMLERIAAEQYPHFTELAREHVLQPGYDYADEFEFGLDMILEALAKLRRRCAPSAPGGESR